MIDLESELVLPALANDRDRLLVMQVAPCIHDELLQQQRLSIELNGTLLAEFELETDAEIAVRIPKETLHQTQPNYLRLAHPDAASPNSLSQDSDNRMLAFAVEQALIRNPSLDGDLQGTESVAVGPNGSDVDDWASIQVTVHVQGVGDIDCLQGRWAGRRQSGLWIEGIAIVVGPELRPGDIEYSALSENGTPSHWCKGGEFCGSRGQNLPFKGLRVRLRETRAATSICSLSATFTDGSQVGPVEGDDASCQAESGAPLEAFLLRIRPLPALRQEPAGSTVDHALEPEPVPKAALVSEVTSLPSPIREQSDKTPLSHVSWLLSQSGPLMPEDTDLKRTTDKAAGEHRGLFGRLLYTLRTFFGR